jgi:hypothetical protein
MNFGHFGGKQNYCVAEFYIFIWGTALGGDEDTWAIKLFSGRMQIQIQFSVKCLEP